MKCDKLTKALVSFLQKIYSCHLCKMGIGDLPEARDLHRMSHVKPPFCDTASNTKICLHMGEWI